MKKLIMAAAAVVAFMIAPHANAQQTGASALYVISDNLAQQSGYDVVVGSNTILLKDASTGRTVVTVKQTNAQTITLSSVVAITPTATPERKEKLLKSIAFFNFSSPVGTLWFEDATGNVTMEHHLNPRFVSPSNIASVAMRFGDAVRAEERVLAK